MKRLNILCIIAYCDLDLLRPDPLVPCTWRFKKSQLRACIDSCMLATLHAGVRRGAISGNAHAQCAEVLHFSDLGKSGEG